MEIHWFFRGSLILFFIPHVEILHSSETALVELIGGHPNT